MKRLYIVVEGQTEREFVNELLSPYLKMNYGIESVTPIVINTGSNEKGGFTKYSDLEKNIKNVLHSKSTDILVTTFVDFYRIPSNVPGYDEAKLLASHSEQVACIERSIDERICDRRFFPYIQLHEFEALLFSSNKGFEMWFSKQEAMLTQRIIDQYDNPEDINTTPQGAPSKRILTIKPDFAKVVEGNFIAESIGIQTIIERCPRFRNWIGLLSQKCLVEQGKKDA